MIIHSRIRHIFIIIMIYHKFLKYIKIEFEILLEFIIIKQIF